LARWSWRIPTGFLVSRRTQDAPKASVSFVYRALTLSRSASHQILLLTSVLYRSPTTPLCMHNGLGSSLFARRYLGNRFFFLFLQVLRCFSSLRLPRFRVLHLAVGSPIRISLDHSLLTAPQSVSSFVTSFIGSSCQGIHRAPFVS